jgi:hypothetical protein
MEYYNDYELSDVNYHTDDDRLITYVIAWDNGCNPKIALKSTIIPHFLVAYSDYKTIYKPTATLITLLLLNSGYNYIIRV